MAGARITLDLQDEGAGAAIARLAAFGEAPLTDALNDMGEYLRQAHRARFEAQQAPDGTPWAALSPRYQARKQRKRPGRGTLTYDGYLKNTLRHQVDGGALLFGTNRPYGAIQHFGGEITMAARSQQAYFRQDQRTGEVGNRFVSKAKSNFAQWTTLPEYKITIPARPWLGLSATDEEQLVLILGDHLARAAGVP